MNSAPREIDRCHGEMMRIGELANLFGGFSQGRRALRGQFGPIAAGQQRGKVGSAAGATSRFGPVA